MYACRSEGRAAPSQSLGLGLARGRMPATSSEWRKSEGCERRQLERNSSGSICIVQMDGPWPIVLTSHRAVRGRRR